MQHLQSRSEKGHSIFSRFKSASHHLYAQLTNDQDYLVLVNDVKFSWAPVLGSHCHFWFITVSSVSFCQLFVGLCMVCFQKSFLAFFTEKFDMIL